MVVFYIRACYRLPSVSFHDNQASHSRDTIWPWKFKVKSQGQSTPVSAASSWLISIVFHIRASYRLLSLSFHDNRASHSQDIIWPWKFKVKGQGQSYPSQRSIQLTHFLFCFTSIGPTIPKIWQIECLIGENGSKILRKNSKKFLSRIPPKFNQVENMIRGIYLLSFVAIGWAVITLSWGQGKLRHASVA